MTPEEYDVPMTVTFRNLHHMIDLGLEGAPAIDIPGHGSLNPVGIRIAYTVPGMTDVRLDCRNTEHWVGYFNLPADECPAWITEIVEKYQPAVPAVDTPTSKEA